MAARGRRGAGGKLLTTTPEVELAAAAACLGIDPYRLLTDDDPFAVAVMQAVVIRAAELHDLHQQNLAVRTANALGRVLGG